jgi:hypothetical protein
MVVFSIARIEKKPRDRSGSGFSHYYLIITLRNFASPNNFELC